MLYQTFPDYPYDFVFIDGPTLRRGPSSQKCFNADFINIVARSGHNVAGLLDQRIGTLWAYRKLIPGAKIIYNPIKRLTRIRAANCRGLNPQIVLSVGRLTSDA